MSGGSPLGDYRERMTYFKDTDAEKNNMIDELIERLELSQAESQQTLSDLENEQASRRRLQDEVKQLENLARMQNAQPFILVLIDADADDYIFREKFLNNGEDGGKEAADELNDRVTAYLQTLCIDLRGTKVMIRAYADVKNLQTACIKNRKMRSGASLGRFVIGFNQRQALFDFVDVGDWKEGADNKIRECLDFYVNSPQCKHIIFGACHDSGYAPYLGKYAADPSANDRITLLKGSLIHPRIANLGFKHTHKFDTIFAPKAVPPAVPTQVLTPSSTSPVRPPSTSTAGQVFINPSPLSERLGPVVHNEVGKRVDKVLDINLTSPYLNFLRQNNLCYWYYLRGRCDGSCTKNHVVANPLNASAFDYLWYLARGGLCNKLRQGKVCDDPKCLYGHELGHQIGSGRV